jgi:glucan phosphoethanolaminetransferase (alkaline phosphatase superfamily)
MARATVAWWLPVVLLGCGFLSRTTTAVQNVILISIDTLRADHLGCYGYERATSPALDLLAAGGVLF